MNQSVYDSIDYLPFGEQIAGGTGSTHKFTGYERDGETGNDYAMARHYASPMGRFLSPDPLGIFAADLTNPQSLNRYAYVLNNPLNFIDPSGMDCIGANGEPDDLLGDPSECDSGGGTWDNTVYCDWSGVYGCDTGPGFGGIEAGGVAQAGPPPPPIGSQPFPDGSMDETDGIPNWLGGSTGSVGLGCTYGAGNCGGGVYGFESTAGLPVSPFAIQVWVFELLRQLSAGQPQKLVMVGTRRPNVPPNWNNCSFYRDGTGAGEVLYQICSRTPDTPYFNCVRGKLLSQYVPNDNPLHEVAIYGFKDHFVDFATCRGQ